MTVNGVRQYAYTSMKSTFPVTRNPFYITNQISLSVNANEYDENKYRTFVELAVSVKCCALPRYNTDCRRSCTDIAIIAGPTLKSHHSSCLLARSLKHHKTTLVDAGSVACSKIGKSSQGTS